MELTIEPEMPPLQVDEHGSCRVGGTRVTLDTIAAHVDEGRSAKAIHQSFPTVSIADIHAVMSYMLRHRDEVQAYLERREREADELQRHIEHESPESLVLQNRTLERRRLLQPE